MPPTAIRLIELISRYIGLSGRTWGLRGWHTAPTFACRLRSPIRSCPRGSLLPSYSVPIFTLTTLDSRFPMWRDLQKAVLFVSFRERNRSFGGSYFRCPWAAPKPEEIPGKVTIQELFLPELPIFCLNFLGGVHGQRYWAG